MPLALWREGVYNNNRNNAEKQGKRQKRRGLHLPFTQASPGVQTLHPGTHTRPCYSDFVTLQLGGKSDNRPEGHMAKILIVDDEQKIRELVKKYAAFEGYEVEEAENGMQAIDKARDREYDLIVMDVMMPELDGFSAVKEIRKHSRVPVIMLSARGEEYDRIHGFEAGVDDYVVKPFSPKELMLRVTAVLGRVTPGAGNAHEEYVAEGLRIDFTARQVEVDGEGKALSPREYELLFYLARNRGIALSRDKLLSDVWGYDFFGDDRTLDTHIKMLRRALGPYSGHIVTLRGTGYRFDG